MRQFAGFFASLLVILVVLVTDCSQDVVPSPPASPKHDLAKRAFFGDQKSNQIINIDLGGLARNGGAVPDSVSIAVPPSPVNTGGSDFDGMGPGGFGKRGKKFKRVKKWWKKTNFNNFK